MNLHWLVSTESISGVGITNCLSKAYLESSFYVKSPNALERFKLALTLLSDTNPPAASIRLLSKSFSGLWSNERGKVDSSLRKATPLEPPAFAT